MRQKTYRVLVVDDETDLHDLFKKRFRELVKQGTLVFEFALNGQEALALINTNVKPFDLVFTDIKMPVMDGLTFLTHLKEMKTEMKTVVISAYDDITNIRTAMNRNAFDFLVKPIVLDDLNLTLEKSIREYDIYKEGIDASKNLVIAIREKEEAVHKERQRLSRDLHDDIGSTLSSINIISNMVLRNKTLNTDEKLKSSIEKINERSQRLLDNMSDIVWCVNPENDVMEEVLARMRIYATTLLEAKGINYSIYFPTQNVDHKLSLDVKNNLYLIFKEAVNNLAKYSCCSKATLSLIVDEKNIRLKIQDDGIGFNTEEVKHRGGLINLQQRAEEIKGRITVSSEIGKGTAIELTMPGIG